MPLRTSLLAALASCLLLCSAASAQGEPDRPAPLSVSDVTGRPGSSEPTATLPKGALLLNGSVDLSSERPDFQSRDARSVVLPNALVRLGLSDRFEARFGTSYTLSRDFAGADTGASGAVDGFTLGGSAGLLEESKFLPAVTLLATASVPLRSLEYSSVGGALRFMLAKDVTSQLGSWANVATAWDGEGKTLALSWTAGLGYGLPLGVSVFGEVFGDATLAPSASLWLDGGVSWQLTELVALDAYGGVAVFGAGASWFTSAGFSVLLPWHRLGGA